MIHAACDAPARHQFDFWVGNWRVTTKDGKPAGTDRITREFDGCVVVERWTGAHGTNGEALNSYMPETQQWQQSWGDNTGLTLHIVGKWNGKAMVLAESHLSAGKPVIDRVTWTALSDGRVREYWQASHDNGTHWEDVFDGYFKRI
jgi:hypothetical protein